VSIGLGSHTSHWLLDPVRSFSRGRVVDFMARIEAGRLVKPTDRSGSTVGKYPIMRVHAVGRVGSQQTVSLDSFPDGDPIFSNGGGKSAHEDGTSWWAHTVEPLSEVTDENPQVS
jgi:hypothetical protein